MRDRGTGHLVLLLRRACEVCEVQTSPRTAQGTLACSRCTTSNKRNKKQKQNTNRYQIYMHIQTNAVTTDSMANAMAMDGAGAGSAGHALPDLGPVLLSPLGSAACRLSARGPKFFPFGSQIQRHVRSSRHVPIERKHTTTREAWVCCLLIRARTAATLGCVMVAGLQQLWTANKLGSEL
jgi:hypothetical protein